MTIEKAISAGKIYQDLSKQITGTYEVSTGAEII